MAKEITTTDKLLKDISDELKKNNDTVESTNEKVKSTNDIAVGDERLQFQDEQKAEIQLSLMKENNSLLASILEKLDSDISESKEKDEKGSSLGFLSKFMPKSLLNLFAPIFKTLFSKQGLMSIGKKLVKFIGAPIAAIFAGIDFFKGWTETKGAIAEKIQGAMSNLLSGLTFGLIKSDKINEAFHNFNNFFFDNVTIPLMDFIMNLPENISKIFSEGFSGLSFESLMNIPSKINDMIKNTFDIDVFKSLMNLPFVSEIVEKVKEGFDNMKIKMQDYIIDPVLNFASYAVESFNEILTKIQNFGTRIKEIAMAPLEAAKNFFKDTKDRYEDFKDNFSFKNLFESDQEKQIRSDIEKKTVETINKTENKQESTTNNNVMTNNNKTIVNEGIDMSVRSDDFYNANPAFNF